MIKSCGSEFIVIQWKNGTICVSYKINKSVILHRIPLSGLVQAYIGSDSTDATACRLSLVEETGVPGENHRQQWMKTKTPQPWPGIEPRPAG